MANPFGTGLAQTPYVSQVLYPQARGGSDAQNRTVQNYGNANTTRSTQIKGTSGQWIEPNGTSAQSPTQQRSADTFGMSQQQLNKLLKDDTSVGNAATLKAKIGAGNPLSNLVPAQFTPINRTPFVITCQRWIEEMSPAQFAVSAAADFASLKTGVPNPLNFMSKYIFCNVNPTQISWSLPLRAVDQKTMAGRVQHVWRKRADRDSYFDEPTLQFTFTSGNIMPLRLSTGNNLVDNALSVVEDLIPGLPRGLSNFHKFYELMNEPKIISSSSNNRRANTTYIFYNSRVFPQMILEGMWTPEGFSFEESADKPFEVTWKASFVVYKTYPEFGNFDQMLQNFVQSGFGKILGSFAGGKIPGLSGTASGNTSSTSYDAITRANLGSMGKTPGG